MVGVNSNERTSYRFWVTLMIVTAKKIDIEAQDFELDFERVFNQHWSRVYNVLFRLVGDPAEAQDLALETFWEYYRNPPASQKNVNGWLYRVAVNTGFNALRSRKRRAHYELEAGLKDIDQKSPPEPEQEILLAEKRSRIQSVLSQMKTRSAQLLILRYSGLNYRELAEALNINPTSVGKLLARAREEFVSHYDQLEGG
jgi:RNA polymerase sigma-70 factor (ECF subfamily)